MRGKSAGLKYGDFGAGQKCGVTCKVQGVGLIPVPPPAFYMLAFPRTTHFTPAPEMLVLCYSMHSNNC